MLSSTARWRCALQPLRDGLRREALFPRRTDDRPGDFDAGGRRGGGPRRHRPREGGFMSTSI